MQAINNYQSLLIFNVHDHFFSNRLQQHSLLQVKNTINYFLINFNFNFLTDIHIHIEFTTQM